MCAAPLDKALAAVVGALPRGEVRDGQARMADAVADALAGGSHLLVQAGTGTGKSVAYLVPAILSGHRVVVSTATKALQEQIVGKDLPQVADALEALLGEEVRFALLKGRGNYLCRIRADEAGDDAQLAFDDRGVAGDVGRLLEWAAETETGDRSEVVPAVSERAWAAVSIAPGECPGAARCSHGWDCFAEQARATAAAADVVVVNHHLLALHLAAGGGVLPEHQSVVVDEAHELEDIVTSAWGADVSAVSLDRLARRCAPYLEADAVDALSDACAGLGDVLRAVPAGRLTTLPGPLAEGLTDAKAALGVAIRELEGERTDAGSADDEERLTRVLAALNALTGADAVLGRALELGEHDVVWVEPGGRGSDVRLRVAPVEVGDRLAERLFDSVTVVATSATLAVGGSFELAAARLGLDPEGAGWVGLDVGSPFDYRSQAMLYTPRRMPAPTGPGAAAHAEAVWDEMAALIAAAGGRTLGLFTSRAAVAAAAEALAPRISCPLHVQGDAAPGVLVRAFAEDERSCLLGTTSFWQGVDVPGAACTLVTIDKLPFPRRDDPLAVARREAADAAGRDGFAEVYLARTALLLAQGVGRLIRSTSDRGVVAILDPRINTARYGKVLVDSLPPMTRWYDREPVAAALARLAAAREGAS